MHVVTRSTFQHLAYLQHYTLGKFVTLRKFCHCTHQKYQTMYNRNIIYCQLHKRRTNSPEMCRLIYSLGFTLNLLPFCTTAENDLATRPQGLPTLRHGAVKCLQLHNTIVLTVLIHAVVTT